MENERKNGAMRVWRFFRVQLLVGLVVGGSIGVVGGNYSQKIDPIIDPIIESLAFSDRYSYVFALLVASVYLLSGILTIISYLFPQHGKWLLGVSEEDIVSQRGLYVWQSVSTIALGLALGVLVIANPLNYIGSTQAFVAFAILMAIGLFCFMKSWQKMDELIKAASNEATTIAYYLMVIIGGGWAVLGHLGFADGPEFLDWLTLFWTMILLAAIYTTYRRGVFEMDGE